MLRFHLVYYIALSLLCPCSNNAAIANEPTKTELEHVRSKIRDVQKEIKRANVETEQTRKELMESELAATKALTRLHHVKKQIKEQNASIHNLTLQKSQYEKELTAEKQRLTEQIRTAYKMGHNDYVKLILNQEDPALVGRMLAYHNYHNRGRIARINTVNEKLQALAAIERSIEQETRTLEQLQRQHEKKVTRYSSFRNSRKAIIDRLQAYIDRQDAELRVLQENEQELAALLNQLRKKDPAAAAAIFADAPPFSSLKGSLAWPVNGRLVEHFGRPKKGENLKWQGVVIDAEAGTAIRAVSSGRVAFADWFRNLGLLLIIDHGNDYMSLYGHNQNLMKKTGDWVRVGEIIATLGDSGGQTRPGLYFEIRQDGTPVNPMQWCRR